MLVLSWGAKLRPLLYLSSASLYWPARYLGIVDNGSRSRDIYVDLSRYLYLVFPILRCRSASAQLFLSDLRSHMVAMFRQSRGESYSILTQMLSGSHYFGFNA